jgi:outer membrane protein
MKKHILPLVMVLFTLSVSAQKFAYVDTEYILNNIPEYKIAQDQLDELSVKWQKEIEEKFAEIDKLYKAYQAEAVLLPEEMKRKKEAAIIAKERDAKELQKQRFGKDGDLYKKRQELVKAIQDKVYNAIEEMATSGNYAIIFDKAGSLSLIYANPRFDKSDEVLEKLGYKPGGYSTGGR